MQQQDDHLLIQKILRGEQNLFAILVRKYQAYVFTLVLRYTNDRNTAEELAQDVFVKVFQGLEGFKADSKFSTWLYIIARNTCISHLRKKSESLVLLEQEDINSRLEQKSVESPEYALHTKSQKQLIIDALKLLPADDAQIISLFYQAEQSIEEISLIMSLSVSATKVKLHRARQKMRELLTEKMMNQYI